MFSSLAKNDFKLSLYNKFFVIVCKLRTINHRKRINCLRCLQYKNQSITITVKYKGVRLERTSSVWYSDSFMPH